MVTTEEETRKQQGWVCERLQACGPSLTAQEILLRSAVSTLEEEPAADDTVQEQPPPEEPKPKSNKRTRRNAN